MSQSRSSWYQSSSTRLSEVNKRSTLPASLSELQYNSVRLIRSDNGFARNQPVNIAQLFIENQRDVAGAVKMSSRPSTPLVSSYGTIYKPSTLETYIPYKRRSLSLEYKPNTNLEGLINGKMSGSGRFKVHDNGSSVLTGIPCDPPREFMKKLEHFEEGSVLLHTLQSQKNEASQLAEDLRHLHAFRQANEISKLADRAAYSIALFNRRKQHGKPIPYCFEWINLPRSNVNLSVPFDVLEVSAIRGLDYHKPYDAPTTLSTFVQLELIHPSHKKAQRIRSQWVRANGEPICYDTTMQFKINKLAYDYAEFLNADDQLQVTVFYARGLAKRSGTLGSVKFTLRGLLQSATVLVSGNLIGEHNEVTGRLEMCLKQNSSVKGNAIDVVRKPWLLLAVPEIPHISTPRLTNDVPVRLFSMPYIANEQCSTKMNNGTAMLSKQIIQYFEMGLIYEEEDETELATITAKMNALYDQFQCDQTREHINAYRETLLRLLQQFRLERQAAEHRDDRNATRYYSRRVELISRELHRYDMDASQHENIHYTQLNDNLYISSNNKQNVEGLTSIYSNSYSQKETGFNKVQITASEMTPTQKDVIIINGQDSLGPTSNVGAQKTRVNERAISVPNLTAESFDSSQRRSNALTITRDGERIIYV